MSRRLVFAKVFEALDDFAFRSKFSTWLHSICFREMKNHRRSEAALKRKKLSTSLDELQARDDVEKDRYEPPDTDPGPDGRLMDERGVPGAQPGRE